MANSITPPPELIGRWEEDWHHSKVKHIELEDHIANEAAQWGADQELEACCEWLEKNCGRWEIPASLRAARRPKPPSLKQQALAVLTQYMTGETILTKDSVDTIRRALEQL
jgi:hypothetical protein